MSAPAAAAFVDPLAAQVDNPRLPSWVRLWCWAMVNADPATGHAPAHLGELRRALGPTAVPRDVSRAIGTARARGLLAPESTASCLVLPGCAVAPCEARHRRRGGRR